MACYGFGTYSNFVRTVGYNQGKGGIIWGGDVLLKMFEDWLSTGGTCEDVRSWYDNYASGPYAYFLAQNEYYDILEPGCSLAMPTYGDVIGFDYETGPTFQNDAQRGISVQVTVFRFNGTDSPDQEDVGSLDIAAAFDNPPVCVYDSASNTFSPQNTLSVTIDNNFTVGFPLVTVANPGMGDIVGFRVTILNYRGTHVGYTTANPPELCAGPPPGGSPGYVGNSYARPDNPRINLNLSMLSGFTDVDAQFCCFAAPYGCCGGPGPGVKPPQFAIPRPEEPVEIGLENVNTPPMKTLIHLSNHTFQFTNNFGVVPKNN